MCWSLLHQDLQLHASIDKVWREQIVSCAEIHPPKPALIIIIITPRRVINSIIQISLVILIQIQISTIAYSQTPPFNSLFRLTSAFKTTTKSMVMAS